MTLHTAQVTSATVCSPVMSRREEGEPTCTLTLKTTFVRKLANITFTDVHRVDQECATEASLECLHVRLLQREIAANLATVPWILRIRTLPNVHGSFHTHSTALLIETLELAHTRSCPSLWVRGLADVLRCNLTCKLGIACVFILSDPVRTLLKVWF